MTEIRGSGGSKLRQNQGRDDGGKGKGLQSSLQSVKKRSDGLGIKHQVPDPKSKSAVTSIAKSGVKPTKTTVKTISKTKTVRSKSEKKAYTLPGQKYDPPEEREPLRIFYESLSKQIPSSEMAEFWMMEHGLLSHEKAKKAYERKQRRQQQLRTGTPVKSVKLERPETSKKSNPVQRNVDFKAKRKVNYNDDDDVEFNTKIKKTRS